MPQVYNKCGILRINARKAGRPLDSLDGQILPLHELIHLLLPLEIPEILIIVV